MEEVKASVMKPETVKSYDDFVTKFGREPTAKEQAIIESVARSRNKYFARLALRAEEKVKKAHDVKYLEEHGVSMCYFEMQTEVGDKNGNKRLDRYTIAAGYQTEKVYYSGRAYTRVTANYSIRVPEDQFSRPKARDVIVRKMRGSHGIDTHFRVVGNVHDHIIRSILKRRFEEAVLLHEAYIPGRLRKISAHGKIIAIVDRNKKTIEESMK